MTSSSKRSFEEAISPVSSPTSASRSHTLPLESSISTSTSQRSAPRASASSISDASHPLQSNAQGFETFSNACTSQVTQRRRLPHKRRRAAASSSALFNGGNMPSQLMAERLRQDGQQGSSLSYQTQESNSLIRERPSISRFSSSFQDISSDDLIQADNIDLPSSTTQLLQQWWVDTDEAFSSFSQSGSDRSTVAEMGSDQGRRSDLPTRLGSPSSVMSVSSTLPTPHSALRRLQSQEREEGEEEEEDVRVPESGSNENNLESHDELMDVFRRLSERDLAESATSRPPLRSTLMLRSTTQMSEVGANVSRSEHAIPEEIDHHSEVADIISSYLEDQEITTSQRMTMSSMLPSARAFTEQDSRSRVNLSGRLASLQAQINSTMFQDLARRNHEVLERYNDLDSTHRLRHTGSPTFPVDDSVGSSQTTSFVSPGHRNLDWSPSDSTFHYRLPSSRHPTRSHRDNSTDAGVIRNEVVADQSLWGEYHHQRLEPSSATFSSLSGLSSRLAYGNSLSSATRRRVGAIDSTGRLRGPTRRQNEQWLGMSNGEEDARESSISRSAMENLANFREQERVMSTYRQMTFPDPEATIAEPSATSSIAVDAHNQPPQLPFLRSRSPFELPYGISSDASTRSDHPSIGEGGSSLTANSRLLPSRPHLRPLTLSSRVAAASSSITDTEPLWRRDATIESGRAGSNSSERGRYSPLWSFSDDLFSLDSSVQHSARSAGTGLQAGSPHSATRPEESNETVDTMISHRDQLSSGLRHRSHFNLGRRSTRDADHNTIASLQASRRLSTHAANLSLRHRNVSSTHLRRRPTLLDADSSAVNMELPSRDRLGLDLLLESRNQDRQVRIENEDDPSTNRMARLASRYTSRRPTSRWDRYLDEVGTSSSGVRSMVEAQSHQDQSASSSQSFFSSISRLTGSNLASTLRSEIATNPANYVADDEFALRDTYEGLLQLSAQIGEAHPKATPANVIGKLPTCLYIHWLGGSCKRNSSSDRDERCLLLGPQKGKAKARVERETAQTESHGAENNKDTSCSICLEDYVKLDMVMSLPCNHAFHESCLSTWLSTARSCPCCRGNVCGEEEKGSSSLRILPELYF